LADSPHSTASNFVASYIGRPYSKTGLHCWELVRRAQAEIFGRTLPAVIEHPGTKIGVARLMARRDSHPGWRRVDAPAHGAVVFMTRAGHGPERAAIHSGIYLALDGGGVLHTDDPHGVVFESLTELRARNWAGLTFHIPD
jgi:hypothetical protein